MAIFGASKGHFLAEITINTDGTKFNGIRWAFVYATDFEKLGSAKAPQSDVWPEFLDDDGFPLRTDIPLKGVLFARMHIIFPQMVEIHFKRLKLGTRFYCMEGHDKMATGIVTQLHI